jgi:hypothetical protein
MESRGFSIGGSPDMYRLRDLKNGMYQIHKKNGPAYEGTPTSIFKTAIKMGIQPGELTYSVEAMQKDNAH